jgi:DNA-binding transcriptional MerR regulator
MLTVGQVATRLGLRTSAVHFYERRGLLPAVARVGGQRRYTDEHLRRLALLRLCQDAGLSLDEISVLLTADAAVWQKLVRARITQLDTDIARLQRARGYLAGSLRCPADHPAADCPYVQREIDNRLTTAPSSARPPEGRARKAPAAAMPGRPVKPRERRT